METEEEGLTEEVKSIAIVKYSVPKPAQFMKLKCNTDLNLPPSNWLSSSADAYGWQHLLYHHKGFSSFRMAHTFPDCVGKVDVVTDADNIKNLLKIPYSKGQISMIVHRVENTLLLDNFDIYKHLLRASKSEWKWLKKFFLENVNHEMYQRDRNIFIKSRQQKALKEKSLVSKFLYHSLGEGVLAEVQNTSIPTPDPSLPEPASSVPESEFDHNYNRNVAWTFEDIEMLIGTDLPIFGGGTHPCISLRLRDATKPISVLTGIDYWLDNLMSNVPEVVMCYHLNGIVQKYELIKTEDLPRLDGSKFSPKLIRDVAQNILSFLKSNATKAGHTYWLFKGKDEDFVKLYDLTSLCSNKNVKTDENPFTVPVAMLLYKVARNMKNSSSRQAATIRMLLKNCIKLLSAEKYPEVVTSSHYILSDLYIPADTDPQCPKLETMEVDDADEYLFDDEDDLDTEAAMKILVLDKNMEKLERTDKSPPPIVGTIEERCLQALQHLASGLSCLQYLPDPEPKEEEQVFAKSSEPIPMPYSKLNTPTKTNTDSKKKKNRKKKEGKSDESALFPKTQNGEWQNLSWKHQLKSLLYEKSALVYMILAEHYYNTYVYGTCLRILGLGARFVLILNHLKAQRQVETEAGILTRAGDCSVMLMKCWDNIDVYRAQFSGYCEEDAKMLEQLVKDEDLFGINMGTSNLKFVFYHEFIDLEQVLVKSADCYEEALTINHHSILLRRLGNSFNEIASLHLNQARVATFVDVTIHACELAETFLNRSLSIFLEIQDDQNTALIYSNLGHLNRILSFAYSPLTRSELTSLENTYTCRAIYNYKRAHQVLIERENCPTIWDIVQWELSTSYYNISSVMRDFPSSKVSAFEAEKRLIEVLLKSLEYCDFVVDGPRLEHYHFRAASIHYHLGSIYHRRVAKNSGESRKNIIQLTKIHYLKAGKFYFICKDVGMYFATQMQKLVFLDYLISATSSSSIKLRYHRGSLEVFLETMEMVQALVKETIALPSDLHVKNQNEENCGSIINLLRERLQAALKNTVKLCLGKPPINKNIAEWADIYKDCYKVSLEIKYGTDKEMLGQMLYVLEQIKVKLKKIEDMD